MKQDWCDWGMKAQRLRRRGRWKEALACYTRAIRLNPLDTASREAYVGDLCAQAECLRRLGRVREAVRCEDEAGRHRRLYTRGAPSFKEELKRLEHRLLEPAVRKDAAVVGELLADDFREFLSSGGTCGKARTIALLKKAPAADASITHFKAVLLAPDVALATFRYSRAATHDRPAAKSIRSSIWKRVDGRWRMVFHQGTLCGGK